MAEMTTIKALAQEQHCTYQAIWKLVTKYEKDLGNHVVKKGRDRFLDEYAVNYILEKRKDHPMVALNVDQSAIIESQKQEIEELKIRISALQNEIIQDKNRISVLIEEKQDLLETKIRNEYLLEDNARLKEDSEKLREDLEKARVNTAVAETKVEELEKGAQRQADVIKFAMRELDSFQPSLFGFYRKKKTKGDDSSLINPE